MATYGSRLRAPAVVAAAWCALGFSAALAQEVQGAGTATGSPVPKNVSVSQSRLEYPLSRMRADLLRTVKNLPERYEFGYQLSEAMKGVPVQEIGETSNKFLWSAFRSAWDSLVRSRSCIVYGVTLAWLDGRLQRI